MVRSLTADAVVFDLGNTLLPFGNDEAEEYIGSWHRLSGIPFSLGEFRSAFMGMVAEERGIRSSSSWESDPQWRSERLCRHLGHVPSGENMEILVRAHSEAFSSALRFPRSSVEFLEEISGWTGPSGSPVRTALISNAMDGIAIRSCLKAHDAARFFSPILISQEVGVTKPDPRIFRMAIDSLGIPASRCVYVGDRYEVDVIGAMSSGMVPIYTREYGTDGEPPSHRVIEVPTIGRLDEIFEVLGDGG